MVASEKMDASMIEFKLRQILAQRSGQSTIGYQEAVALLGEGVPGELIAAALNKMDKAEIDDPAKEAAKLSEADRNLAINEGEIELKNGVKRAAKNKSSKEITEEVIASLGTGKNTDVNEALKKGGLHKTGQS